MEELFKKYLDNQCSPEEVKALLTYFQNPESETQLKGLILETLESIETDDDESQWRPATDKIFDRMQTQLQPGKGKIVPLFRRTWTRIAAAVVLAIGIYSIFNYLNKPDRVAQKIVKADPSSDEILPGGNKATLTLADGSTITLATIVNDTVAKQENTSIFRVADGQLSYSSSDEKSAKLLYNSITTPRGGQYQVTLSDGTKVWLNAASSIHFPVAFNNTERRVEVTGEVYFEVAKNASKPFKVKIADKAEVEVLGTHFNINSYSDEQTINTTLLEGQVKVTGLANNDSHIIAPGEQAELNPNNQISVNKVDVEQAIAWKNGAFNFSNISLATALRQIARWYDVEIVFEGSIPQKQFSGEMQRNLSISQVLKLFEKNGVYCRTEGRKLIVAK